MKAVWMIVCLATLAWTAHSDGFTDPTTPSDLPAQEQQQLRTLHWLIWKAKEQRARQQVDKDIQQLTEKAKTHPQSLGSMFREVMDQKTILGEKTAKVVAQLSQCDNKT